MGAQEMARDLRADLKSRIRYDATAEACVGQAIVQGDEGPVSGVAQGVQVHGVVGVRHEEEKEEGEVEQEVESEKEENNTQGRRHMCMDGMKVKRQMRSALSQSEEVNTSDDATTDCVQCAQCCMVSSSACVASFTLLFTMRSMSVRYIFVREFLVQEIHTANE